nr:hypothetical protein 20 [Paracoccaceae bacterium]
MSTFDQLKTGDLFVCTDSKGVTYKVTWDKIDDIVLPRVAIWHIQNISGGYVNITDYDRIETPDGTNLNLDGSPFQPTSGEYLVYGDLARFKESTGNWDFGPKTDTKYVDNFGDLCRESPNFNGDISYLNTQNGFDLSYMFQGCTTFNQPVTNIDTSKANTLRAMFKQTAFNQSVSHFNTSNVQSMVIMFNQCRTFNQPVDNFDTSNVTEMNGMFQYCREFDQDVSMWDTSKVTNMRTMFSACNKFNSDISSWNTGKVTTMYMMFYNSPIFNQDISSWDTSNVTDMAWMFHTAKAFNQDLSQWCVSQIPSKPFNFDDDASAWTKSRPVWGTCPRGEDQNAAAAAASTEPVYEAVHNPNESIE